MSTLSGADRQYLEELLVTDDNRVLDYSEIEFECFFQHHGVSISDHPYGYGGDSQVNRLRRFWASGSDEVVGKTLSDLLGTYVAIAERNGTDPKSGLLERAYSIVGRLTGHLVEFRTNYDEPDAPTRKFAASSVRKLPIDEAFATVVESRLDEINRAFSAGAYLCVTILCGSVLEAVLQSTAKKIERLLKMHEMRRMQPMAQRSLLANGLLQS